jgi:large subunit ribosomal protein L25
MAEAVTLQAEPRKASGSRDSKKLRKQGRIPGIIYGHKEDNASITVSAEELDRAIRVQHARTMNLKIGGKTETVLIREVQWDYLGKEMIHVDFLRKDASERVKVTVPIELRNSPKAMGGGVLDQPTHILHVECAFSDIPKDPIRIDITELTLGNPIHVKELQVPSTLKVLDLPDQVVVQLKLPGAEAVVAPTLAEPGATPAGPEVIKKEKKVEEEEE